MALPRGHVRWRMREFTRDLNATLSGYVRAQLLSGLIVGTACAAGLALLRVPYAFLLGVAAGVLEFVPAVGPLAVAVAATSLSTGAQAAFVLVFLGTLRVLQDYVILPRLIRKGMHLHPAVVILAIWCGAQAGGIAGVFVALPVVGVMVTAARHWREYREIERLVAHAPTPPHAQVLD
jgi:predicted PurR-regulated permease PerM